MARLMDGFERRAQQQFRLFVAGRPPAFAVDALPCDLELLVDQHHGLGAPAAWARHAVLVEDVMGRQASLHVRLVGLYKLLQ